MRRALLAVVSTVAGLVLLLSFKSHSPNALASRPAAISGSSSTGSSSTGSSSGGSGSSARTVTGAAADTCYGPVQVQITLAGSRLTSVTVLQYPSRDPRDIEINNYALPQLTQEALAANGAKIDMISGATFTSFGYIQSLQSALDRAGA